MADDWGAETHSAVLARNPRILLREPIEHSPQKCRTDTGPIVRNGQFDHRIGALCDDGDAPIDRSELDLVREEIPHDLLNSIRIGAKGLESVGDRDLDLQPFRFNSRAH